MKTGEELLVQNSAPVARAGEIGEVATVTRERAEIQAAVFMAKQCPRDEKLAFERARAAFSRPKMADSAEYSFKRGKKQNEETGQWEDNYVTGASVYCGRELARIWGNCRWGIKILSITDTVYLAGWAWDLESNNYVETPDQFKKAIQRKEYINGKATGKTIWVTPDERDLRELISRRGSIALRNSLLQILPSDLIDEALEAAEATLKKESEAQLKTGVETVVNNIVAAFSKWSVTREMLEEKIGHTLDKITPEELSQLRKIANSLKDGAATKEEHFGVGDGDDVSPAAEAVTKRSEEIQAKLALALGDKTAK